MRRGWLVERATREAAASARCHTGFTLLEVMISLAHPGGGPGGHSQPERRGVAMHAYGRRALRPRCSCAARCSTSRTSCRRTASPISTTRSTAIFSDDGAPEYAWVAEILKPDVQLDPAQLLNLVGGGTQARARSASTGGASAIAGMLSRPGGATSIRGRASRLCSPGPLGGMMQTQAKTFIET